VYFTLKGLPFCLYVFLGVRKNQFRGIAGALGAFAFCAAAIAASDPHTEKCLARTRS